MCKTGASGQHLLVGKGSGVVWKSVPRSVCDPAHPDTPGFDAALLPGCTPNQQGGRVAQAGAGRRIRPTTFKFPCETKRQPSFPHPDHTGHVPNQRKVIPVCVDKMHRAFVCHCNSPPQTSEGLQLRHIKGQQTG